MLAFIFFRNRANGQSRKLLHIGTDISKCTVSTSTWPPSAQVKAILHRWEDITSDLFSSLSLSVTKREILIQMWGLQQLYTAWQLWKSRSRVLSTVFVFDIFCLVKVFMNIFLSMQVWLSWINVKCIFKKVSAFVYFAGILWRASFPWPFRFWTRLIWIDVFVMLALYDS